MLNREEKCGMLSKNRERVEIDTMNKNAITSLSMLYALWESKRQDILSVIRPFVLFSVDQTTKVNGKIDIEAICTVMESEFGYKNFSPAVVDRVLSRETSAKIEQDKRFISKKQNDFFLIKSLAEQTEDFTNQRLRCKEHSDAVGKALTDFLNQKEAWGRNNYT